MPRTAADLQSQADTGHQWCWPSPDSCELCPQLGTAAVCFWRDAALCVLEKSIWGDFSPSLLYFRKQYWCWLWPLLSKGLISQNIHEYKATVSRISLGTFAMNSQHHYPNLWHPWLPAPTGFPVHLIRQQPGALATSKPVGAQGDQVMDTDKLLAVHTANLRDGPWFSSMPTGKDTFTTSQSSRCLHLWQQQDMSPVGGLGQTKFQYWRNFNGCAFKTFWGWG